MTTKQTFQQAVSEFLRLAEMATPGPWENDNGLVCGRYKDGQRSFDIFDADIWPGLEHEGKAIAAFITAARNFAEQYKDELRATLGLAAQKRICPHNSDGGCQDCINAGETRPDRKFSIVTETEPVALDAIQSCYSVRKNAPNSDGSVFIDLGYSTEARAEAAYRAISRLAPRNAHPPTTKPDEKSLAEMIMEMDEAARDQGLYVGAGKTQLLPKTAEEQEGPRWKAIKAKAAVILDGSVKPDDGCYISRGDLIKIKNGIVGDYSDWQNGVLAAQDAIAIIDSALK